MSAGYQSRRLRVGWLPYVEPGTGSCQLAVLVDPNFRICLAGKTGCGPNNDTTLSQCDTLGPIPLNEDVIGRLNHG